MSTVPLIPESAPFNVEQRAWLNGFLAGILSKGEVGTAPSGNPPAEKQKLLIAFGSQSGNAESLAKKLNKEAGTKGFESRVAGLENITPAQLAQEKNVLLITSTWGDGEMPDNAADFWKSLNQNGSSPQLGNIHYSVLALGDKNYGDTFCQAGRELDERFTQLGAQRIHPRVECDVDYDELAKQWSDGVFKSLQGNPGGSTVATNSLAEPESEPAAAEHAPPASAAVYTKKNPWQARLLINLKLNAEGSAKDTRHIAFSLAGSGLTYETGDALGVYVENCTEVVSEVIASHQLDPNSVVTAHTGAEMPLSEALKKHYEVRNLLGKAPEKHVSATEFVEGLRKLQPRLYSIASSQKANPDEVHLCVGAVRYTLEGINHKGVASTFLADRCGLGECAGIFVHTAKHFRVPSDMSKPVIMVGPGTGIAPFRAFIQERIATAATGKNWLFFGDQYAASDYLYRDQIESWKTSGALHNLSLAFSRDQVEKIYVQTRMLEAATELWSWLEEGAHFYVCGDASRMAKDVDAALHKIIETAGDRSAEDAASYVAEMKKAKRYARDVY